MNRTKFGEMIATTDETRAFVAAGRELARLAAKAKKIPMEHDGMRWERVNSRLGNKRIGNATHHEIYDVSADMKKALICVRTAEGTKYGISTTGKSYYVIARHGAGVRVSEANKAIAAKAAKSNGEMLGGAIAVCEGKATLAVKSISGKRTGFKLVAIDDCGELVSAWDDSSWALGKCRTEKSTPDHDGGFYYYRDLSECLDAAAKNDTFGYHRTHRRLAVVSVDASGVEYKIGNGKLCVTRLRPVGIVCMTL